MTDQKKNEFMHKIQTAGITLTTGGIAWAIGLLIHISEALPVMQNQQDNLKKQQEEFQGKINFFDARQQTDENRITILEVNDNTQQALLFKKNFPYNH